MAGEQVAPAGFRAWLLPLGFASLLAVACTRTTKLDDERPAGRPRVGVTQGRAVALTQDERIAVVTNRSDGVVSIIRLDPSQDAANLVSKEAPIDIGFAPLNQSKPWAAVIGADDDTAYVLLRGLREVVKITGLHGRNPRATETVRVGAEPTGIVISPSGKLLYVANWGDGTVSSIVLGNKMLEAPLDLNRRLSDELLVGPLVGNGDPASAVWSNVQLDIGQRKGLAHPRALAITDNGDSNDLDETVYATEFFAQPLPGGGPGGLDDLDHSREGLIYPILVETNGAPPDRNVIPLSALDVSFKDSENKPTGCFPNQMYSAAASGDRLYVTSVCASPGGPLEAGAGDLATNNFKTLLHSAVFVVDTLTNQAVPAESFALTDELAGHYRDDAQALGEPAPVEQRMPLLPVEIVVAAPDASGQRQAFLSAMGSSAVYPIAFAADGTASIGSPGHRYIDLKSGMPIGLAVLSDGRGLVLDDLKPALRILDLASETHLGARDTLSRDWSKDPSTPADERLSDDARDGRRLFSTGLRAWSFQGQAWSSCESCHPDGLSDGVTWRFTRGPRRTISLAGTYYRDEPTRRILLWGANIDEIHDVEVIARNLSGGVGGVVWNGYPGDEPGKDCRLLYDGKNPGADQKTPSCPAPEPTTLRANGLNGSLAMLSPSDPKTHCESTDVVCDINGSRDWTKIDAFARTIRAPQAPTGVDDQARIAKGAALFTKMRCNACHAGAGWTLSRMFYEPGPAANGKVPFADMRESASASALSEMLGLLRTQQYSIPSAAPDAFRAAPGVALVSFRTAPGAEDAPFDFIFGQPAPAAGMPAPPPIPADQIKCALRSVGTFPAQPASPAPADMVGKVPSGSNVPPIREVRRVLNAMGTYDDKLAFGANGFNIPSLVGLATGAPYFHAGNARTLEEVFDPAFAAHYGAMLPKDAPAPSSEDIRNLVTYLLSIDETDDSTPVEPDSSEFDPDLCAQFAP